MFRTVAALTFILANSASALAWGPEGHAVVADIAQTHLIPAAQAKLKTLLGLEGRSELDEISAWADEARLKMPDTAPWHFVNIPLQENRYRAERDCRDNNCVVAKIVEFSQRLADTGVADSERLAALKWLVHFVGDIHQPLHAEDNQDRGGNDVLLALHGKSTNLHSIWDAAILEQALNLHLGPHYSYDHDQVRLAAASLHTVIPAEKRAALMQAGLLASIASTAIACGLRNRMRWLLTPIRPCRAILRASGLLLTKLSNGPSCAINCKKPDYGLPRF